MSAGESYFEIRTACEEREVSKKTPRLSTDTGPKALRWIHYLAFDLLVGSWEARDARDRGVPHVFVVPCLILTLSLWPGGMADVSRCAIGGSTWDSGASAEAKIACAKPLERGAIRSDDIRVNGVRGRNQPRVIFTEPPRCAPLLQRAPSRLRKICSLNGKAL